MDSDSRNDKEMSNEVKCGVIGCGVIAPLHIQCLQQVEGVEVKWVCDLIEEKATKLAEKFGVKHISTDYNELLSDPEVTAIHVCTDHASHAPISVAALEAGKHVLCEKALTAHPDALQSMLDASAQHPDLIFAGVFQHRFEPVNRYLKSLVDDGTFGKLLTANVHLHCLRTDDYYRNDPWRGTWEHEGGGVLINQAIHFIDSLNWISGGVESLAGSISTLTHDEIEVEDTATAALKFKNGALGVLEATSSTEHLKWEHTLSFYGDKGALEIRNNKPITVSFTNPDARKRVESELARINDDPTLESGKVYYGPGHPSQIADFINAIREQRPPFVDAASAKTTVDIVHGIYQSSRGGGWVTLPHPPSV